VIFYGVNLERAVRLILEIFEVFIIFLKKSLRDVGVDIGIFGIVKNGIWEGRKVLVVLCNLDSGVGII